MKQHYQINIINKQASFICFEGQSILHAMLASSGKNYITVGCRGGGCGVCKIEVLNGDYECGVMSKAQVTEQDRKNRRLLSCKVFPHSDMNINCDLSLLNRSINL